MRISICGPAAAGKGTIARAFAVEAGIDYVDLGLLFRLGAFALATKKVVRLEELPVLVKSGTVSYAWTNGKAVIFWQGEDVTDRLVSQEIAHQTSVLASDPGHQEALTEIANCVLGIRPDVVCDGRNASSTILPDADHKFFITARLEERARRRHLDILQRGGSPLTKTYCVTSKNETEGTRNEPPTPWSFPKERSSSKPTTRASKRVSASCGQRSREVRKHPGVQLMLSPGVLFYDTRYVIQ